MIFIVCLFIYNIITTANYLLIQRCNCGLLYCLLFVVWYSNIHNTSVNAHAEGNNIYIFYIGTAHTSMKLLRQNSNNEQLTRYSVIHRGAISGRTSTPHTCLGRRIKITADSLPHPAASRGSWQPTSPDREQRQRTAFLTWSRTEAADSLPHVIANIGSGQHTSPDRELRQWTAYLTRSLSEAEDSLPHPTASRGSGQPTSPDRYQRQRTAYSPLTGGAWVSSEHPRPTRE